MRLPKMKPIRASRARKSIPEAVSIQMAADILGVGESTVRGWIRRGYIRASRVGPCLVRIPRSEIVRMRALRLRFIPYGDPVEYVRV